MSDVQTIAKLVAELGFTVKDEQLNTFIGKLNATIASLKMLKQEVNNRIGISIGLNKTDMIEAKKVISGLGSTKVRLKDVELSHAALSKISSQLSTKVGETKVKLKDVELSEAAIRGINKSIKETAKVTPIKVPVLPDTRQLGKDLREWIKSRGKGFKIWLKVEVNKHDLYVKLNDAIKAAVEKVGTIKLKDPNIKVGIDKEHLRKEIRDALSQIKREMRIKIDLTGHADVSGAGAAGGSRVAAGGVGTRHGALAGGVAGMAASWGRGFIPGLGGAFAVSQLNKQVQEFESQQQAAAAVSGSQTAGADTIERLRAMGNEIGFNYRSQAMPFLRMISSGTNAGMEQGEVETIFGNMAKYGRVMGLDDEAMKGSMRAVEQMLNKQQVYSEELKTQLAERMPGVISAMAEAVTGDATNTAELFKKMEAGEVKSTEVMLKFSQILERRAMEGGALEKAMKSTAAEQARFNNSWNDFVKAFGEAGFSRAMSDFFAGAASMLDSLGKHADKAAQAFRVLMTPILALMRIIEHIDFGEIAKSLGLTTGQLQTMAMVVGGLLFPWTRVLTVISLVVTAVDDLMTWSRGGESLFGNWFEGLDSDKQSELMANFLMIKQAALDVATAFTDVGNALNDLGINWDTIISGMGEKIRGLSAYVSNLAKTVSAVAKGDWSGAVEAARNAGSIAMEGTPFSKVLGMISPERAALNSARVEELTNGKAEEMKKGVSYLNQSGIGWNGQVATAQVGGTTVDINFKLTADEIIKHVGDGSLPKVLEKAVDRATKDWMARELGGAGARLMDYN